MQESIFSPIRTSSSITIFVSSVVLRKGFAPAVSNAVVSGIPARPQGLGGPLNAVSIVR